MSRIRGKDTKPELVVRRLLHALGYRFRLQQRKLPGAPDIVLPKHKTVVFVHGCFWHRHPGCKYAYNPKSRVEFWQRKFDGNVERDARAREALEALGWNVVTVWECEMARLEELSVRLQNAIQRTEPHDFAPPEELPRAAEAPAEYGGKGAKRR